MKFNTTLKLISYLFILFTAFSCLSPGKIDKTIRMSEAQQLNKKYEALFKRSLKNKKSDLLFFGISNNSKKEIMFFLEGHPKNGAWQEGILNFQQILKRTNTPYNSIIINEVTRPSIVYTAKSLEVYSEALELLRRNVSQIKTGQMDELYKTMDTTHVRFSQVKELFDYLKITEFKEEELMIYPSDDYYSEKRTVFKLNASEKTNLFFSYYRTKSGTILRAIDLNDVPIENNFPLNL